MDALGPEVERLSVVSLFPEPVDICAGTTVAVVEVDGAAVRTGGWSCFLNELIDHVKHCVLFRFCFLLNFLIFFSFDQNGCFLFQQL